MRLLFVLFALSCSVMSVQAQACGTMEVQTVDDLGRFEKKLQEVVRRVVPAVVTFRYGGQKLTSSSGVVFDQSGLVLTHGHHDHKANDKLEVVFADGRVVPAKLLSVYRAVGASWSLVKLQKPGKWPAAPLHRGKPPKVNQWCFHLGYPGLLTKEAIRTPALRLGRVVGVGHYGVYANCAIFMGDSGGPLFDLEGRVIGLAESAIGPSHEYASFWTGVPALVADEVLLRAPDLGRERRLLGLVGKHRQPLDKNRGIATAPFDELLGPARRATVQVLVDGRPAALGVVVDAAGIVLTKRAEILTKRCEPAGKLSCRLHDGERLPAQVIADMHEQDFALVRVGRKGLATAPWSQAEEVEQGCLVAAVGREKEPTAVGVVSTDHVFRVKAHRGYSGFSVCPDEGGMRVTGDEERLQRYRHGWGRICSGDLITNVDGQPAPELGSFVKATEGKQFIAGDLIRMTILRNGQPRQLVFPMVTGNPAFDFDGSISRRRTGFPAVIGHDAVLAPNQCGGPLIDARGCVIGVNIARYQKHQTLAVPHRVARRLVEEMMAAAEQE